MRSSFLICLILITNLGLSQSDSSIFKFNSVQISAFSGALWSYDRNYSNFNSFYKNETEYSSVLGPDTSQYNYKISGSSGSSGSLIEAGFIPYSRKNNQYSLKQKVIFGVGYSTFYSPSFYNHQQFTTTIDTLTKYSISDNGDTLQYERVSYDSINYKSERYRYYKNKIIIVGEWNFTLAESKRVDVSLGIGGRFSYLFGGWIRHQYSNYYLYKEGGYNNGGSSSMILEQTNNRYNAKNGIGIEPYLKGRFNYRLSKKDNFFNNLSLEVNTYIGGAFHKINKRKPVISELTFGVGLGLKYSL